MFILCVALSTALAWQWHVDNRWLNDFEIFGPKMFWERQRQLLEHLFFISTVLALIIASTGITMRFIRNR
jgi:hypothetical protein